MARLLTVSDHSRDSAGLTYVYPVVSRRAGGISVGINFNPNHACNWRCLYCQVPELKRGTAPSLDMEQLKHELTGLLSDIFSGKFYRHFTVPSPFQNLRDIAISGNGEPTSLHDFDRAIAAIEAVLREETVPPTTAKVIISNGSLVHRSSVQSGLSRWGKMGGELWFKLDRASTKGLRFINGTTLTPRQLLNNLETAASLCPVKIQTCLFAIDGQPPSKVDQQAYLDFLASALDRNIALREVLVYGLARPSMQPEATRLSPLPITWMEEFSERIKSLGLGVKLTP